MYTTVSARLDTQVKNEAESVLSQLGISHSAAISALYAQIALQKRIPFELKVPEAQPATPLAFGKIRGEVRSVSEQYGAGRVWLFGSYATGKATAKSDVDLLVEQGSMKGMEIGGFAYDLEEALGSEVDITMLKGASTDFLKSIEHDRILLNG